MRRLAISIGTFLVPAAAVAHPDHSGAAGFGLVHFLTDPFHLTVGAFTVAAACLCVAAWRTARSRAGSSRPRH